MFPLPPFLALFRASLLSGTALLAQGELAGLFTDFTVVDQTKAVLVRNNGDTYSSPDSFFSNAGTSPKLVYDVTGTLVWSPHNLVLQSSDFSNAAWTKGTGSSATAGVLTYNSGAGTEVYTATPITTIAGASYTFRIRVSPGTAGNIFRIVTASAGFTESFTTTFDLGAVSVSHGATDGTGLQIVYVNSSITAVGDGSFDLVVSFISNTASAYADFRSGAAGSAGTWNVSRAQLNRGTVPTAYLATTSAARFGLAIDYDPVTHACKGLLVEAAATNLAIRSTLISLGNDPWVSTGGTTITLALNNIAAPNGAVEATRVSFGAGAASTYGVYQQVTYTAAIYTFSVFLKAGATSIVAIDLMNAGASGAVFNLSAGTIGFTDSGVTSSMQAVGNGWYRCIISKLMVAGAGFPEFYLSASATANSKIVTPVGTETFYIWGAQCELGSVATSPIPTFAATVTRARDLPNYLLSAIPSVATAVGMFAEFQQTSQESTVTRVISLDDGTTGTRAFIAVTTSQFRGGVVDATVAQATNDVGSTAINTTQRAAFSVAANDFRFAAGGVLSSPDASGTYPAMTTGRLGYDAQSQALVGGLYIRKFSIVPRILTDGELQARST